MSSVQLRPHLIKLIGSGKETIFPNHGLFIRNFTPSYNALINEIGFQSFGYASWFLEALESSETIQFLDWRIPEYALEMVDPLPDALTIDRLTLFLNFNSWNISSNSSFPVEIEEIKYINGNQDFGINETNNNNLHEFSQRNSKLIRQSSDPDPTIYDIFHYGSGNTMSERTPIFGNKNWFATNNIVRVASTGSTGSTGSKFASGSQISCYDRVLSDHDCYVTQNANTTPATFLVETNRPINPDHLFHVLFIPIGNDGEYFDLVYDYTDELNMIRVRFEFGSNTVRIAKLVNGVPVDFIGSPNLMLADTHYKFGSPNSSGPHLMGIKLDNYQTRPVVELFYVGSRITETILLYDRPVPLTSSGKSIGIRTNASGTRFYAASLSRLLMSGRIDAVNNGLTDRQYNTENISKRWPNSSDFGVQFKLKNLSSELVHVLTADARMDLYYLPYDVNKFEYPSGGVKQNSRTIVTVRRGNYISFKILGTSKVTSNISFVTENGLTINPYSIITYRLPTSTGEIVISGRSVVNYSFNNDFQFTWAKESTLVFDQTFYWDTGQLPIYWYRVIGKGRDGQTCDLVADPCCQKFILNIYARSPSEICKKLADRRFLLPIESIQRFSRPAETAVLNQLEAEGADFDCNILEEVDLCSIPECSLYCLDFDPRIEISVDMFVQNDSFFEFETQDALTIFGSFFATYDDRSVHLYHFSSGTVSVNSQVFVSGSNYLYSPDNQGLILGGESQFVSSSWRYEPQVRITEIEQLPSKSVNESGTSASWTQLQNLTSKDNQTAIATFGNSNFTKVLKLTDFHLDDNFANIEEVIISINRWSSYPGVRDSIVQLMYKDRIVGLNAADQINDLPVGLSFGPKSYSINAFRSELIDFSDVYILLQYAMPFSEPDAVVELDFVSITVRYYRERSDAHLLLDKSTTNSLTENYTLAGSGMVEMYSDSDSNNTFRFKFVSSGSIFLLSSNANRLLLDYDALGFVVIIGSFLSQSSYVDLITTMPFKLDSNTLIKPYHEQSIGGLRMASKYQTGLLRIFRSQGTIQVFGSSTSTTTSLSFQSLGELNVTGDSLTSSSHYDFVSLGDILYIDANATTQSSDFGVLYSGFGLESNVEELFLDNTDVSSDVSSIGNLTGSVNSCSCRLLPFDISLEHNLFRNNEFSHFIQRNNLQYFDRVDLIHNRLYNSWQFNDHFEGASSLESKRERWDFVVSFQCLQSIGGEPIGRDLWKFSFKLEKTIIDTGDNFNTRFLIMLFPENICNLNYLTLDLDYNVNNNMIETDPITEVHTSVLTDNIGLFKNAYWLNFPRMRLSLSEIGFDPRQTRINGEELIST